MFHIGPREADIGQLTIGQVAQFVTHRPTPGERGNAAQHVANLGEQGVLCRRIEIVIGGCRIVVHFRLPQVNSVGPVPRRIACHLRRSVRQKIWLQMKRCTRSSASSDMHQTHWNVMSYEFFGDS
jgi:hypothetical protein